MDAISDNLHGMRTDTKTLSFRNFHDATIAAFRECATPHRDPDFVSPSGSAYWDEGDAVVRASDHWAGQNGCDGQKSCIWSLDASIGPGRYATGRVLYAEMRTRHLAPVAIPVGPEDLRDARILRAAGDALPLADWSHQRASITVPAWARRVFPGPASNPDAAIRLFARRPDLRHAISAERSRIDEILSGAGEVRIGRALARV